MAALSGEDSQVCAGHSTQLRPSRRNNDGETQSSRLLVAAAKPGVVQELDRCWSCIQRHQEPFEWRPFSFHRAVFGDFRCLSWAINGEQQGTAWANAVVCGHGDENGDGAVMCE